MGHAAWGKPDADDVRELLTLCTFGLAESCEPHAWLVDLRALESVDPSTFGLMVDYTRTHGPVLGRKILKQAQLRPEGLVGAIISGFSAVARLPYPEKVFDDVPAALAWAGIDERLGLDTLAEVVAARRASIDRETTTQRLGLVFEAHGALSIGDAARRLALSPRALQRSLAECGTSFRAEAKAFRIRRAEDLLRSHERSLAWIASELGFSSSQHFATTFRKATGETPSAWRTRHAGTNVNTIGADSNVSKGRVLQSEGP
ncbi:MAG: helix-turn-helix transcriptional regulator [Polyangiaceae bacterium]